MELPLRARAEVMRALSPHGGCYDCDYITPCRPGRRCCRPALVTVRAIAAPQADAELLTLGKQFDDLVGPRRGRTLYAAPEALQVIRR
jgi:hypothetical protein